MRPNAQQMMMTFQEVYAKLERVFCAELVHGGWCIFKTEKHIILEKSLHGEKASIADVLGDPERTTDAALPEIDNCEEFDESTDDRLEKADFLRYLQLGSVAEISSLTTARPGDSPLHQPSSFNPHLVRGSFVAPTTKNDNGGGGVKSGGARSGGAKCSQCGSKFVSNHHLARHVQSVHMGVKFACPHCGGAYSRRDSLRAHIAHLHKGKGTTDSDTDNPSTSAHAGGRKSGNNNIRGGEGTNSTLNYDAAASKEEKEVENHAASKGGKSKATADRNRAAGHGAKGRDSPPVKEEVASGSSTSETFGTVSAKKRKVTSGTRNVKSEKRASPKQIGSSSRSKPLRQLQPMQAPLRGKQSPPHKRSSSHSVALPKLPRKSDIRSSLRALPKKDAARPSTEVVSSSPKRPSTPTNGSLSSRKRVELVEVDVNDASVTYMLNNNDNDMINNNNSNDDDDDGDFGKVPERNKESVKKSPESGKSVGKLGAALPVESASDASPGSEPKSAPPAPPLKKRVYQPSLIAKKEMIDESAHYICPHCQHPFKSPIYLRKHLLVSHREKRRYMCLKCLKVFDSNCKLARHGSVHDKPNAISPKKRSKIAD